MPSVSPSDAPTLTPTALPTKSLPSNTVVSVRYPNNTYFEFRMVLPFMFTSGASSLDLSDIVFSNASK
eukprot:gene41245-51060_t